MGNKKKIILLILVIAVFLAFAFTGKKVNRQYWICPTDYTEITFSDGAYYYKSEADNFYLYCSDVEEQHQHCIVRQVPKEIYVVGQWVYFTNLSDGSKLYRVKTDGSGLEMVCAKKISRFFPIGSQFYCLSQNKGEDEVFICTQGGKLQTIYRGECYWISTDGNLLYLDLGNAEEKAQYQTVAINRSGEMKEEYEIYMRDLVPTERYLYYSENEEIIKFDKNTGEKKSFKIPDSLVEGQEDFRYAVRDEEIYILLLGKNEDRELYKLLKYMESKGTFEEICEETDLQGSISLWDRIKSIYLVNGYIFYKNFVLDGKGELWYMLDVSGGVPTIFEKMEETVAVDTSLPGDFFYNGSREGFLNQDVVYTGEQEDGAGNVMGTTIVLPKISEDIPAADQINIKIKAEAEIFYEEQVGYHENQKWNVDNGINGSNGLLKCDYVYADENYVSIVYRKVLWTNDGEYDMQEYVTRLYSSDTGEELKIEDLFKVKWEEVVLRFSYLIRKTELSFNIFFDDFPLVNGDYMRVYYCLTNIGVDIVFVDDIRTFKEYHFVLSYKELADILK